ncbi:hypothetical protein CN378_13020 [Bacillus sp. AFS015802]|nr:hypothetical protein CN378_13020 [Bacillus sp. AFS015802]
MYKKRIVKIKHKWHFVRLHYHQILLDSCIDSKIKVKLQKKVSYHETKVNNLNTTIRNFQ